MEKRPGAACVEIGTIDEFEKQLADTSPLLIQFTAPWCRRCTTLKKEISEAFDGTLRWISVDIDDLSDVQERFNVVQLPRLDVCTNGQTTSSVEGFDAKIDEIRRMLGAVEVTPVFELTDDF